MNPNSQAGTLINFYGELPLTIKNKVYHMKRRHFIQSTSAYLAGSALLPKTLSAAKRVAASDKIRVAAIGINGMGWADLTNMIKHPEAECVALCDVDKNVLDKRVAELKNQNINVAAYGDYRKLLEDKTID